MSMQGEIARKNDVKAMEKIIKKEIEEHQHGQETIEALKRVLRKVKDLLLP